jgi:polyferredoxin
MNKMFATLSMTEVRTWKSNCEGCMTAECKNGGSPTVAHDSYALKGCTMDLKNNQLRDMGDCVMCMSCVANCQRESPEFNVRPLGLDYGLPWLLPKSIQSSQNMALSQVETNFWLGGIICILQGSVSITLVVITLSQYTYTHNTLNLLSGALALFAKNII